MRIGILCLASFGGSARVATQLAVKLSQRGHRVHLFARTAPFGILHHADGIQLHIVKRNMETGVNPARLDTEWTSDDYEAFLSNILDVIGDEGLDILNFHYAVPLAFLAAEVKRRLGWAAPLLIGTLHGTDVSKYGRDPVKNFQLTQVLSNIDALTTVSDNHALLATELFGLFSPPIVIPNFVDLSEFRPLHAHLSTATRLHPKPRIAHVSNFRAVKDPQSMARIFLGIREQMEAELWLIGDGPEMEAVRSILEPSGFGEDVRYWNLQGNVADLLAQTDLLLMTSLSESFCLAALEAMACGVPVLATNVGGLPEVVLHEETGFLFPVGDCDMAVRLAVELLSNRDQHEAMSKAAVCRAASFVDDRIVPIYEDLYRRLLLSKLNRPQILSAYGATGLWGGSDLLEEID